MSSVGEVENAEAERRRLEETGAIVPANEAVAGDPQVDLTKNSTFVGLDQPDTLALKSDMPPSAIVHDESEPWGPQNPGEFGPTVVLLHLERDGVVVEGPIDPYTGDGARDLLVKLQDTLVLARSREDGAAPPAPIVVGEALDPNALKRLRAKARGHELPGNGAHCTNCGAAEWYCLDKAEDCPGPKEGVDGKIDSGETQEHPVV